MNIRNLYKWFAKNNMLHSKKIIQLFNSLCLFFLLNSNAIAQINENQQKQIDSLNHIINNSKDDAAKAGAYVGLSDILYVTDVDTLIPLCTKAIELIEPIFNLAIGVKKNHLLNIKALALNNIGYVYDIRGDINTALDYYLKSLKIREEIGNKSGIAESVNNIGALHRNQGDINTALKYYLKSLQINQEIQDKKGIANSFNNIGVCYMTQEDNENALEYYFKSLKIKEEIGDKSGIVFTLNNIGGIYWNQDSTNKALECYYKSLKIGEEIGDKSGMATSLIGIAQIELEKNNIVQAKKLAAKSMDLAQELGFPYSIRNTANLLHKINIKQNNWKDALRMHELYIQMRDSLNNEETRVASIQKQLQYDFEKKEMEILAEQDKERAVAATESKRQRLFLILIAAVAAAVAVIAIIVFRSLRITRRQKQIIELKNKETEEQKKLIEEKNKDITASIRYAKRIQQAILPKKEEIYSTLPQSFIFYKSKDIVSGDFYFFRKINPFIFIASADCTGHGVPGAFMSMICSEKLYDAVAHSLDPSEILSRLNTGIKNSLNQSDSNESTRDGMDIAFCCIDLKNRIIKYAGANRPLWLIRKDQTEMEEFKPTKKAIGGFTDDNQHFNTHEIKLNQSDTIYIFSDGYADLFNGKNRKKLTTRKFKHILLDIQNKTMQEQEKYLENFADDWLAGTEQIDDILVIGVRIQ